MYRVWNTVLWFSALSFSLLACSGDPQQGADTWHDDAADTSSVVRDISPGDASDGAGCLSDEQCAEVLPSVGGCRRALCRDGACIVEDLPDGAWCTDNNLCTLGDHCSSGVCVERQTVGEEACDDGNPCTSDSCVSTVGCVHNALDGSPCDDGNPCTEGDICDQRSCGSGEYTCAACETDEDCSPFEDDNACNGTLACDEGMCAVRAGSVVVCPPAPQACHEAICEPESGRCVDAPVQDGAVCDDGDPCTSGDACLEGGCVATEYGCQGCVTDGDCALFEDDNLCTGSLFCRDGRCQVDEETVVRCRSTTDICGPEVCSPSTGECLVDALPNGIQCDDGDACTVNDRCVTGACRGNDLDVDDGDACTVDRPGRSSKVVPQVRAARSLPHCRSVPFSICNR